MIVAKLLHVRVQPVFVLVDTDTADVSPGPAVQASDVPAAHVDQLAELIDQARQQIEAQLTEQA